MKLIYIVEEQDLLPPEGQAIEASQAPVPMSRGSSSQSIVIGTGTIARNIMLGGSLALLPFPLVAAALIARPLLGSAYSNDKDKSDSAEWKAIVNIEMQRFMRTNAISENEAAKNNYVFPPGHPEVGRAYVLHPLAGQKGSDKSLIYIPREKYDEVLLEEREAELIKLLVTLGAIRIKITEHESGSRKDAIGAKISAKAPIASTKVEISSSQDQSHSDHNHREFLLSGSDWKMGNTIEKSRFAWIQFEPSWGALVAAREIGGCTKASIELRETTTFSSDRSIEAKVNSRLYGAAASAAANSDSAAQKSYFFEVEFSESKPK